jgi:hypothetical protein
MEDGELALLTCGPFAPVNGRLSLRQMLGCAAIVGLRI